MVVQLEECTIPDANNVIGHIGAAVAPLGDRDHRLAHRHESSVDVGGTRWPHGSACGHCVGSFPAAPIITGGSTRGTASVHHLDHLAHARIDLVRPPATAEHAVMADPGLQVVLL